AQDGVLFANERGEVTETPNANIFFVFGDEVATPPMDAPCLPGIARAIVLEAGRIAGRRVVERAIARDELARAEGCVVTNAVVGARPVGSLLGRELAASSTVAAEMQALVLDAGRSA